MIRSHGFETDPAEVDQSCAIHVNNTEISRYIVDKNFNQFVAGFQDSHRRVPDTAETAAWFHLFVAQLALKTQLVHDGYLGRPDIAENVARMSRYILTKTDGPLYQTLYNRQPISPERVQAALTTTERSFDAFIVRFDDNENARRELDQAGGIATFATLHAQPRPESTGADIFDGPIHWPFHPFEEISDDLASATTNQILGPLHRELGVYYAIIRRMNKTNAPGPTLSPAEMERTLKMLDDDLARRRHRTGILRRGQFTANLPAIETAIARLLSSPGSDSTIGPEVWAQLADSILASYESDGAPHRITANDFARYFNHRVIPRKPRTAADLVTGLQEMMIEEFDDRTARQLHLDRTPKFVEDQRNFALNQALAVFEQEGLLSRWHPTTDELQEYASAHRDAYLISMESSGTLYIFADQERAGNAADRLRQADTLFAASHAVQTIDSFTVRKDGTQLLGNLPNGAVIASPAGAVFGPFAYAGKQAVFMKRTSGDRVPPPYAAIEQQVRRDFLRAKLDEAELHLFQGSVAALSLQFHFDLGKYGLTPAFALSFASQSATLPDFRPARMGTQTGAHSAGSD